MRIGIDIDNTLTDINDKLIKAAIEYAKTLNKYVENTNLNINDVYNVSTIQEEITNNAIPVEVIKKLHDDGNRYNIDNLPYHITIFANNKDKQYEMLNLTKEINVDKIEIKVNDIKIMKGRYDSFVLYLSIENNNEIKNLQSIYIF